MLENLVQILLIMANKMRRTQRWVLHKIDVLLLQEWEINYWHSPCLKNIHFWTRWTELRVGFYIMIHGQSKAELSPLKPAECVDPMTTCLAHKQNMLRRQTPVYEE